MFCHSLTFALFVLVLLQEFKTTLKIYISILLQSCKQICANLCPHKNVECSNCMKFRTHKLKTFNSISRYYLKKRSTTKSLHKKQDTIISSLCLSVSLFCKKKYFTTIYGTMKTKRYVSQSLKHFQGTLEINLLNK